VCSFWNVTARQYSTTGCISLPNPAPLGAQLYWLPAAAAAAAWAVGNATWLEGCTETLAAADPAYAGTDAGLRKWLGADCALAAAPAAAPAAARAGCWWDWPSQAFAGPGCEWSDRLHCRCDHLTDFQAVLDMEVGRVEPPTVRRAHARPPATALP
jgi:hypothetical protein